MLHVSLQSYLFCLEFKKTVSPKNQFTARVCMLHDRHAPPLPLSCYAIIIMLLYDSSLFYGIIYIVLSARIGYLVPTSQIAPISYLGFCSLLLSIHFVIHFAGKKTAPYIYHNNS